MITITFTFIPKFSFKILVYDISNAGEQKRKNEFRYIYKKKDRIVAWVPSNDGNKVKTSEK